MATAPKRYDSGLPRGLDVDAFLAWAKGRAGRFELHDGDVIAMAPERVGHATVKFAVQQALDTALRANRLDCHMLPDGVAVHVSDSKWYEPDAIVYCGAKAHADDLNVVEPMIVVEVTSPSTARRDETVKLIGYFSVPSVRHYLVVDPSDGRVVHHRRQPDGNILTSIVPVASVLTLDPPGIAIDTSAFRT